MLTKADWAHWNQMPTAYLWECCFLAAGLDPRKGNADDVYESRYAPDKSNVCAFYQIAARHLKARTLPSQSGWGDEKYATIPTVAFIEWATKMNWSIPSEWTGYALPTPKTPITTTPTPSPSNPATPTPPKAAPESAQAERNKAALTRIIGAMLSYAKGEQGMEPRGKISQAQLITVLCAKFGHYDGISKSNLEKVFREANQSVSE